MRKHGNRKVKINNKVENAVYWHDAGALIFCHFTQCSGILFITWYVWSVIRSSRVITYCKDIRQFLIL